MSERGWSRFRLWLLAGVVCAGGAFDAGASKIYTYTDEKGNFVATDSLENVPPKHRARIKEREVQDSPRAPVQQAPSPTAVPPSQGGPESFASGLAEYFPKSLTIPGLTPGQSMGMLGGAIAGMLAIVAMLLSGNPFANVLAKMLLKFVVPLVAVGAIAAMYLSYIFQIGEPTASGSGKPGRPASPGSIVQKAVDSAKAQEAAQQQKAKAIESILEPIEQPPPPAAGHR